MPAIAPPAVPTARRRAKRRPVSCNPPDLQILGASGPGVNLRPIDRFLDRRDAGRRLAQRLILYAGRDDVVVLALPRGGVPVAFEVAQALDAPLEVFLVRKLGVPGHPELAMGAIASGGVRIVNAEVVDELAIG